VTLALTVLGGSPAWPNPGQAASGYVLEGGEARVLVDCGSGIAAELRARDPGPIDAVIVTHWHADHSFDLVPLHYAYRYGSWHKRQAPVLYVPPGGRQTLDTMASLWGGSLETFTAAFELIEFDPRSELVVGDLRFRFAPSLHYTTCYSVDVSSREGRIVYSGDSGPTERLVDFARGADVFLCEAALRNGPVEGEDRGHLDAREAGEIATRAGVHRLILTHVPAENGEDDVIGQARQEYDGPVELAKPGLRCEVVRSSQRA
jgi:ribonuclease BN (tRNA processing enzyme)